MERQEKKIRLGVTMGDMNGIGPELILKIFAQKNILDHCTPIIYGSDKVFSYYKKIFHTYEPSFHIIHNALPHTIKSDRVNLINIESDAETVVEMGYPSEASGLLAFNCIEQATTDLKSKSIDALVTAPIHKSSIYSEKFSFIGHTYFFENFFKTPTLMLMCNEETSLRIASLTHHIPLKEVASSINSQLLEEKLDIFYHSLREDFTISSPKIALLGLNPHAGDEGLIGNEENEIMTPVIKKFNKEAKVIFGPYPADSFFATEKYKSFDGIMGMYHDQALIPFKLLAFERGVNFTAGLPAVRTSPAHGTSFQIAGKNIALTGSMLSSIFSAISIAKKRNYQE